MYSIGGVIIGLFLTLVGALFIIAMSKVWKAYKQSKDDITH